MKIERWHEIQEGNPAWWLVEILKKYLKKEFGLDPERAVIPFISLEQIMPILEKNFPSQIDKIVIADIDGVFNNVFNPSLWPSSKILKEIANWASRTIICSHRIAIDENGWLWRKFISKLPNREKLTYSFPFLSEQQISSLKNGLVPGEPEKVGIITGSKWPSGAATEQIFQEIDYFCQHSVSPYVVCIGSGLPDIWLFTRIVKHLKQINGPYDQATLLINGHLFQ